MEGQSNSGTTKAVISVVWIVSLIMVAITSFIFGKSSNISSTTSQLIPSPTTAQNLLIEPTQALAVEITSSPSETPVDLDSICDVTGPSPKKDYLVSYIIKEGDTINKIAEEELGSTTRNTEILTLNDNIQQLTLGSVLYLPPSYIKQSSGHIYEVSGKIVRKDITAWQLSYGGGVKGTGILFPGYWFKDIEDSEEYKLGDCVTILFDNGVKVYSVKKS